MVSGARKCSCTELTGKILSWPSVIQIFIRQDNLVKKIQMEEGKRNSFFFFLVFLSHLQITKAVKQTNKKGGKWWVTPSPPWMSSLKSLLTIWLTIFHKLKWVLRHFSSGRDTCHCTMGAILVKNKTLCRRRESFPMTQLMARWQAGSEKQKKKQNALPVRLRSLPYLIPSTAVR